MTDTHAHEMQNTEATYHLCPKCLRAIPSGSQEHYCSNDGQKLLEACPGCARKITSPFARFCSGCGLEFRNAQASSLVTEFLDDSDGP
jgi:predicted amidophosphoribosyltransferase